AFLVHETGIQLLGKHSAPDSPTRNPYTPRRAACSRYQPLATAAAHRSGWYTRPGSPSPPTTVRGARGAVSVPPIERRQGTQPPPERATPTSGEASRSYHSCASPWAGVAAPHEAIGLTRFQGFRTAFPELAPPRESA